MSDPTLNTFRIAGRLDDLLIDGVAQEATANVSAERQDFWRSERQADEGIVIVKNSTATPKAQIDPYSPVVIPEI